MKNTDTRFPPLQWGTSYDKGLPLEVETDGKDHVRVIGFDPLVALESRPDLRSWDLFEQYRKAPKDWSRGQTGKHSPHIRFANADTDDKLLAFVRRFGPVVATSVSEEVKTPTNDRLEPIPPLLKANQDWNELRTERSLYSSLLTLLVQIRKGASLDGTV